MLKLMMIAGAGGFLGTCARFLVGKWCAGFWSSPFPFGTFLVNIFGCFVIGLIFGLVEKTRLCFSEEYMLLLVTGFCGGFTTFSAFTNEIWILSERGLRLTALLYLTLSIIIGLILVWAGRAIVR